MKDEIKEILKYIQKYTDEYETTNLTEIRALQMGYVDTVLLLDYITNLQDRIKELEQINEEHRKINGELRNGYCEIKEKCNKGECDCTNEEYESMAQVNMKSRLLLDDYKTRNEKAIEYINISLRDSFENDKYPLNGEDFEHLLNILQNGEKNE